VAAIAKGRAANINECTAVGDSRYRGAKDIVAGCRGNRTQYRSAAAVSARGCSANLVRDHRIGVNAAAYKLRRNESGVSATGYKANLIRDHATGISAADYRANLIRDYETGISATGYRANLIGNHGTGVNGAGYSCQFFRRW
jgi:hypothetical protein